MSPRIEGGWRTMYSVRCKDGCGGLKSSVTVKLPVTVWSRRDRTVVGHRADAKVGQPRPHLPIAALLDEDIEGFTSLWMIPIECAAASARATRPRFQPTRQRTPPVTFFCSIPIP